MNRMGIYYDFSYDGYDDYYDGDSYDYDSLVDHDYDHDYDVYFREMESYCECDCECAVCKYDSVCPHSDREYRTKENEW